MTFKLLAFSLTLGLIGGVAGCGSDAESDVSRDFGTAGSGAASAASAGAAGGSGPQKLLLKFPNNFNYHAIGSSSRDY